MRGKALSIPFAFVEPRITPAYAGKRLCVAAERNIQQDHPRLCGEKPVFLCNPEKNTRITPAYAGKSYCL